MIMGEVKEGNITAGALPFVGNGASNPLALGEIQITGETEFSEVTERMRQIEFRGVYSMNHDPVRPYENARFSLVTVEPPETREYPPTIVTETGERHPLWTPQPTVYENQSAVIGRVATFLASEGLSLTQLSGAVDYHWSGRGDFTILPPIIEAQQLPLLEGKIDLASFSNRFRGLFVPDDRGTLHDMSRRMLRNFYVDEVSCIDTLDVFNDTLELLSYGVQDNEDWTYYIICDGSHRIDYALELSGEPIQVILAEPADKKPLYPYYALPMPFRPTTRLSSKKAEAMYPNLERDKVHILSKLIRKVLHYDWAKGGLNVSSLRSESVK